MKLRVLGSLAITLIACNAILGNESSITYLDGDAQVPRGGGPGDDDGGDADGDGGAADAPIADAPSADVDAIALIDAARCDADFCTNFDPPLDVGPYGFAELDLNGGTVTTSTAYAVSAPNGLRVASKVANPGPLLIEKVDGAVPFTLTFQFYVLRAGDLDLVEIECGASDVVAAGTNDAGAAFVAFDTDVTAAGTPLGGGWRRVTIAIAASTVTLEVVDSADAGMVLARAHTCSGPYSIRLGLPIVRSVPNIAGAAIVFFDDVVANAAP